MASCQSSGPASRLGRVSPSSRMGLDVDAGQAGDGERERLLLLDLGAAADDAAAGAAQHHNLRAEHLAHQFGQRTVVGGVLGRGEDDRQIGGVVPQRGTDGSDAFGQRGAESILLGYGGSPLHDTHLTGL